MSGPPAPARSLASAIQDADDKATVLDDRLEVEDAAVLAWLRGHELHHNALHRLVIGRDPLPAPWRARAKTFTNARDAEAFVRRVAHDHRALLALRRLGADDAPAAPPPSDDDLFALIAARLVSGSFWAVEARPIKSRFVGKTSPAAFAPINPRYGTRIDFAFIAKLEGDQWLRGYVPMRKGVVIGRSGMTVASGFDIGQWSARQIDGFGFPPALADKLRPFAGHPFRHMKKADVAAKVAKIGPVPELTKAEADLCDGAVFGQILSDAMAKWERERSDDVPGFTALPGGWQTVWLSRNYQEGGATKVAAGKVFRAAALDGRWSDAVAALKGYTQYKSRAIAEAALLEADMPAEIKRP